MGGTERQQLIERLRAATGPDRQLGNDVLLACGWRIEEQGHDPTNPRTVWVPPDDGEDFVDGDQPDPTASVDAALMLMPSNCQWTLEQDSAWVRWMGKKDLEEAQEYLFRRCGKCTAVALVIAILKAGAQP